MEQTNLKDTKTLQDYNLKLTDNYVLLSKYHSEIIHNNHSTLIVSQSGVLVIDDVLTLNIGDTYLHYQPCYMHVEPYEIEEKFYDSNNNTIFIAKQLPTFRY